MILGGLILMAGDFGLPLVPGLKLFTYFGAWGYRSAVLLLHWYSHRRCVNAWSGRAWGS